MITEITKLTTKLDLNNFENFSYNKSIFFDIETTGFSAKFTFVYLIGCAYFSENQWHSIQWFANTQSCESKIIYAFLEFIKNHKTLISYNGIGFDLPYLKNRCSILKIPHTLDTMVHIDLYKVIMPYKKILKLEYLKQKSIEDFLSIQRKDKFNGGELINVYHDYMQNPDDNLLRILLLHNLNDIEGLLSILPMITYQYLFDGIFSIQTIMINKKDFVNSKIENEIIFQLFLPYTIPKRISFSFDSLYFTAEHNTVKLKTNIYNGELKYFYKNYKDYYYLPKEDTSLHKSVAFYVDKDFRTKSKAANCYSRKTGRFLLQYKDIISPYFKIDYFDSSTYFELTDEILSNSDLMKEYILHIFSHIRK